MAEIIQSETGLKAGEQVSYGPFFSFWQNYLNTRHLSPNPKFIVVYVFNMSVIISALNTWLYNLWTFCQISVNLIPFLGLSYTCIAHEKVSWGQYAENMSCIFSKSHFFIYTMLWPILCIINSCCFSNHELKLFTCSMSIHEKVWSAEMDALTKLKLLKLNARFTGFTAIDALWQCCGVLFV